MRYYISVMCKDGEYAHAIEASHMTSAKLAAEMLHTDALVSVPLKRPVLVREDGKVMGLGNTFEDEDGATWIVAGWTLPKGGHPGSINLRRPVTGTSIVEHHCFNPAQFRMRWVGMETARMRGQAKNRHMSYS